MSATHGFKFEAPDGKLRVADVLNSEGVVLLAKKYPGNRANNFFDWFKRRVNWSQIDKNGYLNAMRESVSDSIRYKGRLTT